MGVRGKKHRIKLDFTKQVSTAKKQGSWAENCSFYTVCKDTSIELDQTVSATVLLPLMFF